MNPAEFEILVETLRKALVGPSKSLPPTLTQTGKRTIVMLNYKLTLPAATDPDVVAWHLETTVEGSEPVVSDVTDGQTLSFESGANVTLRLQEGDDATPQNWGPWSEPYAFTATDSLAPGQPGQPVLELISET